MSAAVWDLGRANQFTKELGAAFDYVTSEPLACVTYRNAIVTPRRYFENRTFTGAVYDERGALVPSTLRFNANDIRPVDPAGLDEADIASAQECRHRSGVYGGILFPILGHFLVETMARFWPLVDLGLRNSPSSDRPTPVCFHHWPSLDVPGLWANPLFKGMFEQFGLGAADLLIADRPMFFETLIVPQPASIYHERLDRRMHTVFQHISGGMLQGVAATARQKGRAVYLSRSRWADNRRILNESELDDAMTARGIEVVHPQDLSPASLFELLRTVDTLIAVDGSQGHLVAFCQPGTRVVMLDTRITPTQIALEKLVGLPSIHIPLFESGLYHDGVINEVDALAAMIVKSVTNL